MTAKYPSQVYLTVFGNSALQQGSFVFSYYYARRNVTIPYIGVSDQSGMSATVTIIVIIVVVAVVVLLAGGIVLFVFVMREKRRKDKVLIL